MKPRAKFKPSLADQKRANNDAQRYYAALSGRPVPDGALATVKDKVTRNAAGSDGRPLERDVSKEIVGIAARLQDVHLWRNNMGQVMLPNGGRLSFGVGPIGASDFIGYRRVTVTQEMVGTVVAQFLAVEAKRPGAALRSDQQDFIARVTVDGGCAGVARSGEDALNILRKK